MRAFKCGYVWTFPSINAQSELKVQKSSILLSKLESSDTPWNKAYAVESSHYCLRALYTARAW